MAPHAIMQYQYQIVWAKEFYHRGFCQTKIKQGIVVNYGCAKQIVLKQSALLFYLTKKEKLPQ